MKFSATLAAAVLALPGAAFAAPIVLDFGSNQDFANFHVQGSQIDLVGVAAGIDARFTALNGWDPVANRDTANVRRGDLGIRANEGDTAQIRLELFDAGTNFGTLYDPGRGFEWALALYDIDSDPENEPNGTSFDSFLLRTPGTVELAQNSVLTTTQQTGGLLVAADRTRVNTNTNQGVTSLSAAQARYAAIYKVEDTSTIEFDYIIGALPGDANDLTDRARIAYIDGGTLSIDDPVRVDVSPVPVPAAFGLLAAALGVLGFGSARRRA